MKNLLQLRLLILCLLFNSISYAQDADKTMYIFGHSLLLHLTSTDETTVPHWLHHLAEFDSRTIEVTGQYGFLPQHDNLPPTSQWGFTDVTSPWDSDLESFTDANFNTILITAGNFVQYKPSNENYDGPENLTSPLQSTLNIIDWIENNEPTAVTYIYENWPDMGLFSASFPPNAAEFENYNNYTQGGFHDWWIDYHDFIQTDRPSEHVRLIPVGSIISKLLTQAPLNGIPILDLYEDDAPHGRATIYFLASLVTYMAIYEKKAPVSYMVPNSIHALLRNNYESTIDFIWDELLAFNDSSGQSKVFANSLLSTNDDFTQHRISIFPNPTNNIVNIEGVLNIDFIELYDINGRLISFKKNINKASFHISNLSKGMYILKVGTMNGEVFTKRIIKE